MSFWKKVKSLFSGNGQQSKHCCGGGCHQNKASFDISDDHISTIKQLDAKIVIGKIHEIFNHPDPKVTKVRITKTEVAPGEFEQILCGAGNIAVGQIVPVALVGANLSEDFQIGERKIRGEMSRGMICARDELGMEKIEDGIWDLGDHFEIHLGTSLRDL